MGCRDFPKAALQVTLAALLALTAVLSLSAWCCPAAGFPALHGRDQALSPSGGHELDGSPQDSRLPGEIVVIPEPSRVHALARLLGEFREILSGDLKEALVRYASVPGAPAVRLPLREGVDEEVACRLFLASGLVRAAEPNLVFRASTTVPDDPLFNRQWNLNGIYGIRADQAWDLQRGSSSITLAVVDTGVDFSHQDLAGRLRSDGYDFYNQDPDPSDDNGHGTMVTGIACANTDNGRGMAGVDWYAKVLPVKSLNSEGEGRLEAVVNGIYYAASHGARVINLSLTSSLYSKSLAEAVEYAHQRGCVLVAAAGNEGTSRLNYPAALTYVIGVGSIGRSGIRSSFSNYNRSVDLVAPGEEIVGTQIGSRYASGTGTSEAAPQVAAAATLILAQHPDATSDEVWRRLRDSARDLGAPGYDEEYGWGLLDLHGALRVPLVRVTSPEAYGYPTSGNVAALAAGEAIRFLELWVDGELKDSYELPVPSPAASHTFTAWDLAELGEGTHEVAVRAVTADGTLSGAHQVTVYRNRGQPRPSTDWYLAEGSTAWGFEEYVLVQNPNSSPVTAEVTFMASGGDNHFFRFPMAADSRLTLDVNALVPSSDVSTHVHAELPVVAERAMYWGGRTAGHVSTGATLTSRDWYLAEGSTAWGFEEYVLVQNPNPQANQVQVTFMHGDGSTETFGFPMFPNSRLTVDVNALVPSSDVSTHVHAELPVVAERAMYWNGRDGGHATLGVVEASPTWYLGEGSTDWGFEEWILVQNPNPQPTGVIIELMDSDGSRLRRVDTVGGYSRYTLNVADVAPRSDVSASVRADLPVIVERAMYWSKGSRSRAEGHCSTGSTTAARTWYLAEGSTAWGFQEYILLANVSDEVAHVTLTFMRTDGTTRDYPISIPSGSRYTVYANAVDPGQDASVRVASDMPLVVERAMYWSEKEGGTATMGVLQP